VLLWAATEQARDASAARPSGGGLNLTAQSTAPKLAPRFGTRTLREGMTGPDVRVLKGIVRSKSLLKGSPVTHEFDSPTTSAVRRFQRRAKISTSGIVNRFTARRLIGSMKTAGASWYGPGFYGNRTACGQTYRPGTMGVAHKTLPCGSKVMIGYKGRYLITKVIDRGPFVAGRAWDLSNAARIALKFDGVGDVRHAVISRR
jgi:rare lipoprotein A (peptidoglycan hydrolase)